MDPISDMLTAIRNAQAAKKEAVKIPYSRFKHEIAERIRDAGFFRSVEKKGRKSRRYIEIELGYENSRGTIHGIRKISKPGRRLYFKKEALYPIKHGLGVMILATSKGVMTDREARKLGIGGEALVEVW